MKKFLVRGSKDDYIVHKVEFCNLYRLIDHINENPFEFVSSGLGASHEVFIAEFINGDYYEAVTLNPITGEVQTSEIYLKQLRASNFAKLYKFSDRRQRNTTRARMGIIFR